VNISNKQSGAADKGWASTWGLGIGLTTHHKKLSLLRNVSKGLGPGRIYLDK
jgi:hypothetical protein